MMRKIKIFSMSENKFSDKKIQEKIDEWQKKTKASIDNTEIACSNKRIIIIVYYWDLD